MVAIGLLSLSLALQALRTTVALYLGKSTHLAELQRALALDPENPEVSHWLGLVYLYSLEETNAPTGLKFLRRATELNPHQAVYWSDLASACESLGDLACADQGFERSLILAPKKPRFYWMSANYYLRTGRPTRALPLFQQLLQLDAEYSLPTFNLCLRNFDDADLVFRKLLPSSCDTRIKLAYADFLSARGKADSAYRVWTSTIREGFRFPFSSAESYLERLMALGRDEEAVSVWRDLKQLGIIRESTDSSAENLIYNGSFEQPPLNSGFDWRYQELPYVSIGFPESNAYQGARCLRITFTVRSNEEHELLHQMVPVLPGRDYLLSAHARSDDITSDSGPRLRVLDPACPGCLNASSDRTVGTTPWHPLSLRFSTGPKTRLVRVSIWRPRSRVFPAEIEGQFWLDAVSLRSLTRARGDIGLTTVSTYGLIDHER